MSRRGVLAEVFGVSLTEAALRPTLTATVGYEWEHPEQGNLQIVWSWGKVHSEGWMVTRGSSPKPLITELLPRSRPMGGSGAALGARLQSAISAALQGKSGDWKVDWRAVLGSPPTQSRLR